MNWNNVQLVFLREVRDQLRDRRTLFLIAVLPLLLYPALGIGMVQMTVLFTEQPRTVLILGADDLPDFCTQCAPGGKKTTIPPLLDGPHFRAAYFRNPQDVSRLRIVTDRQPAEDAKELPAKLRKLLERKEEVLALLHERKNVDEDSERARELNRKISRWMAEAGAQLILVVPSGFTKHLEEVNAKLAAGVRQGEEASSPPGLMVLRNSADEKSLIAYRRAREVLHQWEEAVLKERLRRARLPEQLASPLAVEQIEVAEEKQISANLWSKLFPALLVIMAVTGAFYPAVDLVAGEKERGTMETLLICPARRIEIVFGKFLTVMAFSMSTALLNLISMGLTGKYMLSIIGSGAASRMGGISPPGITAILWVVLLLIPLAALFSALSLAFATFARSSKEGQYYLTPLLIVTLGLTVFCLSPVVRMEPFYSIMPVVGPTLLLKELLSSTGAGHALLYALPVLVTSFAYSALALWWAVEQFAREDILFREAERFDVRLWVKHLLRDKEPTPTFGEAVFCFVLIMLLQFGAMKFMGDVIAGTSADNRGVMMVQLLMVQQLVIIATPALMMGVMLTSRPLTTFRLRWPRWQFFCTAALLAVVLHPVTVELSVVLQRSFFPPLPENVSAQFAIMSDWQQPLWFVLLAFAAAPAVCEEIAFRGFILSGFSRSGRYGLAIVLSSAAFGLMHMIPQQVFNAALLGLLLGLLAIRSDSLLPGILFHLLYNSLAVLHSRAGEMEIDFLQHEPLGWLLRRENGHLRYEWPLLLLCAIVAVPLIVRLLRKDRRSPPRSVPADSAETAPLPDADPAAETASERAAAIES